MSDNIILLRHYIFIDPNDIFCNINENNILIEIQKKHTQNYTNGEIIKYYGYKDIVNLLEKYDDTLCKLFLELNCNYPALLADIGRLVILYTYGGIYHDLKCMSTKKMIDYLKPVSNDIELNGEEHPTPKFSYKVRNGNIVALHKNSNFIKSVLKKITKDLQQNKNAFGRTKVFEIGSGNYINSILNNTNQNIYIYPFINERMLIFDREIYSKNGKKWQNTEEFLFKNHK